MGKSATIKALTQTIRNQVSRGKYISGHLNKNALDVSIRGLRGRREIFEKIANKYAKKVLFEKKRYPHYHLEF